MYQGRPSRVVCARDLTALHAAATQLQENEARLRRVLEGSQQGYWERNVLTNQVTFSDRWFEMLGYQPSELAQTYETWENLLHPEDKPAALAALQAHVEGRADHYEVEYRMRTKAGEWRWIFTRGQTVRRDAAGHALYISGTHTDIHERKEMEARLRDREGLLSSINATLVGSAVFRYQVSPEGRLSCTYASPNVATFLGVDPVEILARPEAILARIVPEDRPLIQATTRRVTGTGEDTSLTVRMLHPDGGVRWLHFRGSLMIERLRDGTQVHTGVLTDITAIKEAEAKVRRQAEFLDALHQTTLDLLNRRDPDDLMQAIVDRATALLDAPVGQILLKENEEMVVVAFTGNQPLVKGCRLRREEAPFSWQAHDQARPVVVPDYSAHPGRRKCYDSLSLQAVAEFPILHHQACLGVLSLARTEPGRPFTAEEIRRGEILAENAALVMHNASIYAGAVREAEQRTVELRESEEKYRGLVTTMNDGVFVVDAEGRLTFANPALAHLMGYQ